MQRILVNVDRHRIHVNDMGSWGNVLNISFLFENGCNKLIGLAIHKLIDK